MRKTLVLVLALLSGATILSAQNLIAVRTGFVADNNGNVVCNNPSTELTIDITVRHEVLRTGPYARFAQKYLGIIAPLADKESYTIVGAAIGYIDQPVNSALLATAPNSSTTASHLGSASEFARLLPDRRSSIEGSNDEMASAAANAIFELRTNRQQLISGAAGENVFGAGLAAALDALDKTENEYLALFLGKQTVETLNYRFWVVPVKDKASYVVSRFSEVKGVLPENDLTGMPLIVELKSDGTLEAVYGKIKESRTKGDTEVAVADNMIARLMNGKTEVTRTTVPVWQSGIRTQVVLTQSAK